MSIEELKSLRVYDLVETFSPFKGLSEEPVVLQVVKTQVADESLAVDFVATWFGVALGRWLVRHDKEGLRWIT